MALPPSAEFRLPATLSRPKPQPRLGTKPEVAEKPHGLIPHRRSLEGVVEAGASSYSTQSLERRPGRPPVHARTTCERPSVPPPERPRSQNLDPTHVRAIVPDADASARDNGHSYGADESKGHPVSREHTDNLVTQILPSNIVPEECDPHSVAMEGSSHKEGVESNDCPLSLDHQEQLSFADDSDSEDKEETDESRKRQSPHALSNGVKEHRDSSNARWNFLTGGEPEAVPERPPRISPPAELLLCSTKTTSLADDLKARSSPPPDINTNGPPPDLIASSEASKTMAAAVTSPERKMAPSLICGGAAPEETRL